MLTKSVASATLNPMDRPTPSAVTPPRKPGRPRSSATPDAIRRAAETLFAERGFSHTSIRDIATLAGSDPAVVIRHFGSKEKLFLEVVAVDPQFRGLVEGPLPTLGRQILQRLFEADGATLRLHATLLGALDRPDVRRYLEQSTAQHITDPLAARLPGVDAAVRARLISAQIGGLLMSICLFDDTATPLPTAAALDYYAEAMQVLIDGPNPN
jgi:AcrR family transcriptional regulator